MKQEQTILSRVTLKGEEVKYVDVFFGLNVRRKCRVSTSLAALSAVKQQAAYQARRRASWGRYKEEQSKES